MAAVSIVDPKIPNLSQDFVYFFKESFITCLFKTFCIYTPYKKRKLINGAIT